MATKTAVGSAAWAQFEKENVLQMLEQEKEELIYPAQHEVEWLNEHMADIFNNNSIDVANIFKTPGKLRGKTPRTARKRVAETRVPLSNIFSSVAPTQSSPQKIVKSPRFPVAQDNEDHRVVPKSQADSGYHGSSQVQEPSQKTPEIPLRSPLRTLKSPISEIKEAEDEVHTTEGSFHSAKENQTVKLGEPEAAVSVEDVPVEIVKDVEMKDVKHPHFEDIGSPSDESTPDRPPVRKKSSMNFASLPAREPLKQSIGASMSRSSHGVINRDSQHAVKRSVSVPVQQEDSDFEMSDDDDDDDGSNIEILGVDESQLESQAAKQYSKASTQRLHERIDALGKIPAERPMKSIPAAIFNKRTSTRSASILDEEKDEDDWIKPLAEEKEVVQPNEHSDVEDDMYMRAPELVAHEHRMQQFSSSPHRPGYGHMKPASTITLASPNKVLEEPPASPAKSISGSHQVLESTTPHGSPAKFLDGPLSASKAKFASYIKSAKGLFTSSASVSAAAKMETLTGQTKEAMPGMFPANSNLDKPLPAHPPDEARQPRSSKESSRDEKQRQNHAEALQRMDEQLEKARNLEKEKVQQQLTNSPKKENERPAASSSKVSRPVKPGRDISKSKPQPVSIKVGTLSHRMNATQDTLQGEPKRPGLVKKSSATSLTQGSSNLAFKASINSQPAKPRALLVAERKKEQDEREAQRKLEQKREIERKRAAQQEEARKQEQEQRTEAEKKERERIAVERARRQAQQQAIERKRQEAVRKAEQQRADRAVNDTATSRPPSRLGQQPITRPLINHALPTNPAKPAKRPVEEDVSKPPSTRPGVASQQTDAKRRRTEEEPMDVPARPTMSGAPIRQSQLGKKPSIFNHSSYQQVPSQPHLGQFPPPPRNPSQMAQFANTKIPFAEPSNAGLAKTPISAYQHKTIQAVKSSPQYQNGESIQLPDIPTDSEDESDDEGSNAFPVPEWATPGHLIEQLMRQEGMDGDAVFGPIAPLKMEEIFAKGNKDRLKKLRDRTSSANWAISGDGLTLEEVKADREQRERMRIQGGWLFGN